MRYLRLEEDITHIKYSVNNGCHFLLLLLLLQFVLFLKKIYLFVREKEHTHPHARANTSRGRGTERGNLKLTPGLRALSYVPKTTT